MAAGGACGHPHEENEAQLYVKDGDIFLQPVSSTMYTAGAGA